MHPIGLAVFLTFIGFKPRNKMSIDISIVGASRVNVFLFKQLSGPMHERTLVDLVVWLNLRVTRRLENTLVKGTVNVILSDPPFVERHVEITTFG